MPFSATFNASARYIAPVSIYKKPKAFAKRFATVLLPAPAGPSIAKMKLRACIFARAARVIGFAPTVQKTPETKRSRRHHHRFLPLRPRTDLRSPEPSRPYDHHASLRSPRAGVFVLRSASRPHAHRRQRPIGAAPRPLPRSGRILYTAVPSLRTPWSRPRRARRPRTG